MIVSAVDYLTTVPPSRPFLNSYRTFRNLCTVMYPKVTWFRYIYRKNYRRKYKIYAAPVYPRKNRTVTRIKYLIFTVPPNTRRPTSVVIAIIIEHYYYNMDFPPEQKEFCGWYQDFVKKNARMWKYPGVRDTGNRSTYRSRLIHSRTPAATPMAQMR